MEHSFDHRLSNDKNEFLVAKQKAYADADANAQVIAAQTWLNISNGSFEQGYDSILAKDKKLPSRNKA